MCECFVEKKCMKRITVILFLIALAACSAYSQAKSADVLQKQIKGMKADKSFSVEYDKASDTSKILGFSEDFGAGQDKKYNLTWFRFGLAVFFPGSVLKAWPDSYLLTFQAGAKKPLFGSAHSVILTVDGGALDLGDSSYAAKRDETEYLNFKISREQLGKLANAKSVTMKIGEKDFTLSPNQIKMFSTLNNLSDPNSH
jgi:hypothetical protein